MKAIHYPCLRTWFGEELHVTQDQRPGGICARSSKQPYGDEASTLHCGARRVNER